MTVKKIHWWKGLKTILILLFASSCVTVEDDFDYEDYDPGFNAVEAFSYNLIIQEETGISIQGIDGDIIVEASSSVDEIWINGSMIVSSDSQSDADNHLTDLSIDIDRSETDFLIESLLPENYEGRSYYIDYHLIIPVDFEVNINIESGWIQIVAMRNDIFINSMIGDIDLDDTYGNLDISLEFGDIYCIHELPYNGRVVLENVYGDINFNIPTETSSKVNINNPYGMIYLDNLDFFYERETYFSYYGVLGYGEGKINLINTYGDIYLTGF